MPLSAAISVLQQALRQFHRRYFRAPNLTLWLQGPQSLAQLHALAQRYGSRLPSGSAIPHKASPPLTAAKDYTLSLPGTPQLRLVFALPCSHARGWLRRLERLLLDEAPAGLLGCALRRGAMRFGSIIRAAARTTRC